MWVVFYLFAVIGVLMGAQSVALVAFNQPLQWTFGASSQQPKSLRMTLRFILQGSLAASLVFFPYLAGTTPAAYFGPLFRLDHFGYFFYGQVLAILVLAAIFALELKMGWIRYERRWPLRKTLGKCFFSGVSSLTVVGMEEPAFRGVLLRGFLAAGLPSFPAIALSAALFSGAHFIRKVPTYWPAVGLGVLGLWLGVAYAETGSLWLPMGLHSGGILAIGVHRCFTRYCPEGNCREWLVGTQTFPIAGLVAIAIMLAGAVATWQLF